MTETKLFFGPGSRGGGDDDDDDERTNEREGWRQTREFEFLKLLVG